MTCPSLSSRLEHLDYIRYCYENSQCDAFTPYSNPIASKYSPQSLGLPKGPFPVGLPVRDSNALLPPPHILAT
jgi:hypothetical protein